MQIEELRQKKSREQLSQLEAERLHKLQLELLEKGASIAASYEDIISDSAPSELEASRSQEIVMQIMDELSQRKSREQSQPEIEKLHSLQLELKEDITTSNSLSEVEASRVQEIIMQIEELTQKQYNQPLTQIEAGRLHQLQLELITKDFAAYQSLQQNLITRLSSLAIEKEKRYQSYNLNDKASKQFVAADPGPLVKTIQQFNPMWQSSERITGNEYNADSSRDNQNKTFRKF